jgi:hypothetical protein
MEANMNNSKIFVITKNGKDAGRVFATSKSDAIFKARGLDPDTPITDFDAHLAIKANSAMTSEELAFAEGYAITNPTRRKGGRAAFIQAYRAAFPFSERTDSAIHNFRFLPHDAGAVKKGDKPEPDAEGATLTAGDPDIVYYDGDPIQLYNPKRNAEKADKAASVCLKIPYKRLTPEMRRAFLETATKEELINQVLYLLEQMEALANG